MKKILALISSIGLVASTSVSVVSCAETKENYKVDKFTKEDTKIINSIIKNKNVFKLTINGNEKYSDLKNFNSKFWNDNFEKIINNFENKNKLKVYFENIEQIIWGMQGEMDDFDGNKLSIREALEKERPADADHQWPWHFNSKKEGIIELNFYYRDNFSYFYEEDNTEKINNFSISLTLI